MQTAENADEVRAIFKRSDVLLTEFSKQQEAWQVVFEALQTPNLTDNQYFHASNIFKNKLKIDFVTLKYSHTGQNMSALEQVMSLKNNLLSAIKSFADQGKKNFILDNLCLGMAYTVFHTHNVWNNLVEELIKELSNTDQQA